MRSKWVKRIVMMLTSLIFLNGVFWVIFGSVVLSKNNDLDPKQQTTMSHVLKAVIFFGGFLILWSFLGFYGITRRQNCLLGIYYSGIFFTLMLSIFLLFLSIYMAVELPEFLDDKDCTKQGLLIMFRKLNENGTSLLCKQNCICKYAGSATSAVSLGIDNYNNKYGVIRAQDCPTFEQVSQKDFMNIQDKSLSDIVNILSETEGILECSGVCSINPFYTFSNLNDTPPGKDCKEAVLSIFDKYTKDFIKAACILCFTLLSNIISSCCLCFKKKRNTSYVEINGKGYFTKS